MEGKGTSDRHFFADPYYLPYQKLGEFSTEKPPRVAGGGGRLALAGSPLPATLPESLQSGEKALPLRSAGRFIVVGTRRVPTIMQLVKS